MAIVKATCPDCGDVEVTIAEVQVQVCASTSWATYSFQCPICQLMVNKDANERVIGALTRAGVRVMMWTLPAELDEPKIGPAITHDDLLSFHLALQDDRWQDEVAGVGPER